MTLSGDGELGTAETGAGAADIATVLVPRRYRRRGARIGAVALAASCASCRTTAMEISRRTCSELDLAPALTSTPRPSRWHVRLS
jgi:hypothetical protein